MLNESTHKNTCTVPKQLPNVPLHAHTAHGQSLLLHLEPVAFNTLQAITIAVTRDPDSAAVTHYTPPPAHQRTNSTILPCPQRGSFHSGTLDNPSAAKNSFTLGISPSSSSAVKNSDALMFPAAHRSANLSSFSVLFTAPNAAAANLRFGSADSTLDKSSGSLVKSKMPAETAWPKKRPSRKGPLGTSKLQPA